MTIDQIVVVAHFLTFPTKLVIVYMIISAWLKVTYTA